MPKLFDQVSDTMRRRIESSYLYWMRQVLLFHQKRHPNETGAPVVKEFLTHLASRRLVAASTQNQALAALMVLYKGALDTALPWLTEIQWQCCIN